MTPLEGLRLILNRLAFDANIHQRRSKYPNLHLVAEFHLDLVGVVWNLRHPANKATRCYDGISAPNLRDHFLMLLGALLLRPDQQEVKDHYHQQHR